MYSLKTPPKSNQKVAVKEEKQKIHPVLRAKALAYEIPSKHVAKSIVTAQKRVKEYAMKAPNPGPKQQVPKYENFNYKTIGAHPKAVEAQKRLHMEKIREEKVKTQQLQDLLDSQLTCRRATKVETFMTPHPTKFRDPLSREQRQRVERILNDDRGRSAQRLF